MTEFGTRSSSRGTSRRFVLVLVGWLSCAAVATSGCERASAPGDGSGASSEGPTASVARPGPDGSPAPGGAPSPAPPAPVEGGSTPPAGGEGVSPSGPAVGLASSGAADAGGGSILPVRDLPPEPVIEVPRLAEVAKRAGLTIDGHEGSPEDNLRFPAGAFVERIVTTDGDARVFVVMVQYPSSRFAAPHVRDVLHAASQPGSRERVLSRGRVVVHVRAGSGEVSERVASRLQVALGWDPATDVAPAPVMEPLPTTR